MMKERVMAVFFGLIMLLSVAGFAITSIQTTPQPGNVTIPTITNQPLSKEAFRTALLSGRSILQHHYLVGCTSCEALTPDLEIFANSLEGFIVLEEFSTQFQNETKFQLVGSDGRVTELNESSPNLGGLLDIFCEISVAQPKQCLLRNLGNTYTNQSLVL